MKPLAVLPALPGSKNRRARIKCPRCFQVVIRRLDTIKGLVSCGCARKKYPDKETARRVYYENNKERLDLCKRRWIKKNKERLKWWYRDWHLRKKYGLTYNDKLSLLAQQKGGCAVCGTKKGNPWMVIDHDHVTGNNRGVLCSKCNTGLGMFGDNVAVLKKAIEYLKRGKK